MPIMQFVFGLCISVKHATLEQPYDYELSVNVFFVPFSFKPIERLNVKRFFSSPFFHNWRLILKCIDDHSVAAHNVLLSLSLGVEWSHEQSAIWHSLSCHSIIHLRFNHFISTNNDSHFVSSRQSVNQLVNTASLITHHAVLRLHFSNAQAHEHTPIWRQLLTFARALAFCLSIVRYVLCTFRLLLWRNYWQSLPARACVFQE